MRAALAARGFDDRWRGNERGQQAETGTNDAGPGERASWPPGSVAKQRSSLVCARSLATVGNSVGNVRGQIAGTARYLRLTSAKSPQPYKTITEPHQGTS